MIRTRIAYAAWEPTRSATLDALLLDVRDARWLVHESLAKEHSSTWARRMWEAAAADYPATHTAFLNDDVRVCPRWQETLEAIVEAVPDQIIALHHVRAHTHPGPWARAYWLTGPGYLVPRSLLGEVIDAVSALWRRFPEGNEDNLTMMWAWAKQRPIWHCIPAPVRHSAEVPSILGHDRHVCRETNVAWDTMPTVDMTRAEYWRPQGQPPLVECPWMPMETLRVTHRKLNEERAA